MSKVIFTYKKIYTTFECNMEDNIGEICQEFTSKIDMNIEKLYFLYKGNDINKDLTFQQLADEKDKERKTINIIAVEINKNFNNEINQTEEKEKTNKLNEYKDKINYQFKNNPILKYNLDITNTNDNFGLSDIFEVFVSYKDNKEYIVSPNINHNLDIFTLDIDNKKILSIEGHKQRISTIRYFINNKNNNEYLISADRNKIVIVWDITDNYNIKFQIDTKYSKHIYSCLLLFPNNNEEDFIITSCSGSSDDSNAASTKVYSLINGSLNKFISNSKENKIWYLLSWYNKTNNKYYIIQLADKKIIINDLLEEEPDILLTNEPEHNHYSGFVYSQDDNDYLCSSSQNGYVNIWDLDKKNIYKIINFYNSKCNLLHIIQWNNKYIICADAWSQSFEIIDIRINKVISKLKGKHTDNVLCVKKVYHPIYGEVLFTAARDKIIKLWTI